MTFTITRGAGLPGNVDFVLDTESTEPIRILQLTDTQTIDLDAVRNPVRNEQIRAVYFYDERFSMEERCYGQVKKLVSELSPDLIVLTGDNVYGEFDDKGRMMKEFVALMDSFGIPWAPVFGNHDNESRLGVTWQKEQFLAAKHCLFADQPVTGNCNYSILIRQNGTPTRLLFFFDANGCRVIGNPGAPEEGLLVDNPDYDKIAQRAGLYPDQTAWFVRVVTGLEKETGRRVPSLAFLHAPLRAFRDTLLAKYGQFEETLDLTAPEDEGWLDEGDFFPIDPFNSFYEVAEVLGLNGVFVGHYHNNAAKITGKKAVFVFGMKTGDVTYPPRPRRTGGTLITVTPDGAVPGVAFVPAD
ncbi:MAG: metallophosphoesterase [Lachnospiraceae bacterium]|nr:metallophosphoesterase [Lachnospiraceae bacterium]